MAQVSYPGVYIEEVPSGVRAIAGVSSSIAAFVDRFRRGATDRAVEIFSMGDFEREFGGLDPNSPASYAIAQFFLNGGSHAWVVRVVPPAGGTADARAASVGIGNVAGDTVLTITANSHGVWANEAVRIRVGTPRTDGTFDVVVAEYRTSLTVPAVIERYRAEDVDDLAEQINTRSRLVTATVVAGGGTQLAPNGMIVRLPNLPTVSLPSGISGASFQLELRVGTTLAHTATIAIPTWAAADAPVTQSALASLLERAIRDAEPGRQAFAGASLRNENGTWILRPGVGDYHPGARFIAGGAPPPAVVGLLGLATSTTSTFLTNPQEYVVGTSWSNQGAQRVSVVGRDGPARTPAELIGSESEKTGMYRLLDVDLFNLLCIPAAAEFADPADRSAVYAQAEALCRRERAFLLIDVNEDDFGSFADARDSLRSELATSANAAVYFPRVQIPDPAAEYVPRSFGASGTMAGIFARTDAERGVWHAPAGVDAVLRGVVDLDVKLTDPENGVLNKLAINCLRGFPVQGRISWGARTLEGADEGATEWKYVPIRRLALMIEESLYRGTKWAVFQPNDEPLWARLRQNIGAYMHRLFRQRAFQGATPREAYYVKCDREINPPTDRELGIVTVEVGFAPLKPAEFVVIRIQQIAEIV